MRRSPPITRKGLRLGSSQVLGAIRLVPVLRDQEIKGLRLLQGLTPEGAVGGPYRSQTDLVYVPHGLIMPWHVEREPAWVAAEGTLIGSPGRLGAGGFSGGDLVPHAPPRPGQRVAMMPMQEALDRLMLRQYGVTRPLRSLYGENTVALGRPGARDAMVAGPAIEGLSEALATFEILDGQVGALVHVCDTLAAAFVLPSARDYRALHETLIGDFFAEMLAIHARRVDFGAAVETLPVRLESRGVTSLDELRASLVRARGELARYVETLSADLFEANLEREVLKQRGDFSLERFITDLDPRRRVAHVGEAIFTRHNRLAYLKTSLLSRQQIRRAYLFSRLHAHRWDLEAAARALRESVPSVQARLTRFGFGHLLKPDALAALQTGALGKRVTPQRRRRSRRR